MKVEIDAYGKSTCLYYEEEKYRERLHLQVKDIQTEAKNACLKSQGTETEEIARAINTEVKKWRIGDEEEMTKNIEGLIEIFRMRMPHLPGYEHIFEEIEGIRNENDLVKQYYIVSRLVGLIPIFNSMPDRAVQDIREIKEKATCIDEKLDVIQEELNQGFEKLDKLSAEICGKEGESIKIFSELLFEMAKKEDSKALKRFLEEVLKNKETLIQKIENSSAPQNEKEESKGNFSKLRSLLDKIKNPAKEFGKDVTNGVVVSFVTKGIINLVLPMMSMAVFGVPIPSQIIEILKAVVTELNE